MRPSTTALMPWPRYCGTSPATIAHSVVGIPPGPSVTAQSTPFGRGTPSHTTGSVHA